MVVKTVLIVGASNPGAIEHFYRRGFEKCGIEVHTHTVADQYYEAIGKNIINKVINKISADYFYKSINEQLLVFIAKKKYDVILVFKGMELFPDTVQHLREHASVLANYNADHPFIFYFPGSGNKNVLHSIPHFDVHFSFSKAIVEQLKSKFGKTAFCIPFGFDGYAVRSIPAFPNVYEKKALFIGAYDGKRAKYLNELASDKVDIYGDDKWRTRSLFRPYIKGAFKGKPLYGGDYINAITQSMGVLNLLRQQNIIEDSHNMRTFEVPAYGGVLISQKTSEQLEFFEDGKEAIFFDSMEELKEKIDFLAMNPEQVGSIKNAAYNRSIRSAYSYDDRSSQLIHSIQTNF